MSVITPTILSSGQAMNRAYELVSIDTIKEVNRIASAQLVLVDGSLARQRFEISNTDFFEPGKEIEIKLRYENEAKNEATIFKGLVVRHRVEMDAQGSLLMVDLKDVAVKMTQLRKSTVYRDQSDADIIRAIVTNNGLKTKSVDKTQPRHREIVQYYCSDWDFLLSRADAQGLLVITDDGKVTANKVSLEGRASHHFEYGGANGIHGFSIEADASSQRGAMTSTAWSITDQSLRPVVNAQNFRVIQGNLRSGPLAKSMGASSESLSNPVPLEQAELKAWANARLTRSRMALIRGRITVPGIANLKPLAIIEIAGIGERFNGKTLATGVRHRASLQGWLTDIQFGLSPDCFNRQPDIADVPAAGLLPPVSGLRIGVVAPFEEDPNGEFRVKTILPGLGANGKETIWARLATPEAGNKRGYFFRPEPGDEVVLGFFNDDPRQAVILGALYSSHNTPPNGFATLSENNINKGLVTKSGIKIELVDDKKAKVRIETPEANQILLDDDGQSIELTDQHGNSIVMNSKGIEIKSASDLKVAADGKVEITGKQVDVK